MGKSPELAIIRFPEGWSRISILAQSAVRPPRSTRPSIVPPAEELAGRHAIMNGDISNHALYPKSTGQPFWSPVPATQPARRRPSIQVCGTFSGNEGISAARWLRKLEQEFQNEDHYAGKVQPFVLLPALDFLLTGAALEWAEESLAILTTFTKSHLTAEDVETIKKMINERFPAKTIELSTQAF